MIKPSGAVNPRRKDLKMKDTLKKLNEIERELDAADLWAYDYQFQSYQYNREVNKVINVSYKLANLQVPNVTDAELNRLWNESWESGAIAYLPENKYNQCRNYIEKIKELLK